MKKKIIPCLDMKDGKVVKGIQFENIQTIGDPIELALEYEKQGADELVFLDISATLEKRKTTLDAIAKLSKEIHIPFTVGGGVHSLEDMEPIFEVGASKISMSTAAYQCPDLIRKASEKYGSEKIVIAIDVKKVADRWHVMIEGGHTDTGVCAIEWAKQCEQLGAGELLVTSKDDDGKQNGYDIELYQALHKAVSLPIIASGGCGCLEDFYEVFEQGQVQAALAASLFHYGMVTVQQVKSYLVNREIWPDFKKQNGLVPAIVQEYQSKEVLMLAYMNEESFKQTITTKKATYYSRSRKSLWIKGETSGHYQYVKSMYIDCDADTILLQVDQVGAACHTGHRSCFYRKWVEEYE